MALNSLSFLLSYFLVSCVFLQEITCIQYTPDVTIHSGKIRGSIVKLNTGGSVRKYLGIPFAKAERFAQPTDPEPWSDVKDTVKLGKICPQQESLLFAKLADMSEDCLNLNVFVPDGAVSPLPVMVWIHGGAFMTGSSGIYDGSYIASLGQVIIVAIHYRLNAFGFMATSKDSDLKGNYGMLDQVYALKWIQKNIKQFGGDVNNVTIFGESAGGGSVSHLVLSPMAKGLFQKAIAQSGDSTASWAYHTYDEMLNVSKSMGKHVGCTDVKTMYSCMKDKTMKEIVSKVAKIAPYIFTPVVGDDFLPDVPAALMAKEKIDVTMMIGFNDNEGTVFTNEPFGEPTAINVTHGVKRAMFERIVRGGNMTLDIVPDRNKIITEAMLYRYTDWSNVDDPDRNRRLLVDMLGDAMFVAPAVNTSNTLSEKSVKVYMYYLQYRLDYILTKRVPSWIKAYHAADIPILFGSPLLAAAVTNTSVYTKDCNFTRVVITLWTNFAKTGNPNTPTSPGLVWPQYDTKQQQYLALKPNLSVQSKLRTEYMAFWNSFVSSAVKIGPTHPPIGPRPSGPSSVPSSGNTVTINGLLSLTLVSVLLLCV